MVTDCKKVVVLLLFVLLEGPFVWCVLLFWELLVLTLVANGCGGGCSAVVTAKRTIIVSIDTYIVRRAQLNANNI